MIKGGIGGSNTQSGLAFEERVDILNILAKVSGYDVKGKTVFYDGENVAESLKKNDLYIFLKNSGVDYKTRISKKLLPDEALLNHKDKTLYIIEMKFQNVAGSVDEKLQTCDFKKKQYIKLMSGTGYEVEYIYILNDWFKKPEYKDVIEYIDEVGCHHYFNVLPLVKIGLPA